MGEGQLSVKIAGGDALDSAIMLDFLPCVLQQQRLCIRDLLATKGKIDRVFLQRE